MTAQELRDAEDQAPQSSASPSTSQPVAGPEKSLYNQGQTASGRLNFTNLAGGNRKKVAIGGAAAIAAATLIAIIAYIGSSLELPHLHNILNRRLLSSSRTLIRNITTLSTEKVAVDLTTDAEAQKLLSQSKLGKALNAYNPRVAIRNMKAEGALDFETDPKTGKITGVLIDGQRVPAPELKKFSPLKNRTAWKNFYKDIYAKTDQALLRDGQSYIVRTRVSKALITEFGGKLWFWERKGIRDKNKTLKEAVRDTQLTLFDDIQDPNTAKNGAITDNLNKAAQNAVKDERDCLAKPDCADKARQLSLFEASGAAKRVGDYAKQIKDVTDPLHSAVSSFYIIGAPLCMIYDGSTKTAKTIIEAQQSSALRAYLTVANASDQQIPGHTIGQAVGGLVNYIGDFHDTNPEKLARNEPINTTNEPYSQTARLQNYTIFDTVFGGGAAATGAADLANWMCPILLSNELLIILLTYQATAFLTGPIKAFVDRLASEGVKIAAQTAMKQVFNSTFKRIFSNSLEGRVLRSSALKFGVANGTAYATTDALTIAARMAVEAEMGALINGGDRKDFVNQADMGAVAYNTQMDRQQNFGRPVTADESQKIALLDKQYLSAHRAKQSIFQQYLALSNPDSVASNTAVTTYEAMQKPGRIVTALLHFPKYFLAAFHSLFSPFNAKAKAAATEYTTTYNMAPWTWTPDEQSFIDNDPSFDPLVNAKLVEPHADAIAAEYGACFTDSMGDLLSGEKYGGEANRKVQLDDQTGNVIANRGDCSPDNLSYKNTKFNTKFGDKMVLRWRYYMSLQKSVCELLDIQNVNNPKPVQSELCQVTQ